MPRRHTLRAEPADQVASISARASAIGFPASFDAFGSFADVFVQNGECFRALSFAPITDKHANAGI